MLDGLEAERVAVDAFDAALEDFLGPAGAPSEPTGPDAPDRLELVASYTPDGSATWCAPPTRTCEAAASAFPASRRSARPQPSGEAERLVAAARAALAELGPAGGQETVTERASATLERCLALLERLPGSQPAAPARLKDLELKRERQGARHRRV